MSRPETDVIILCGGLGTRLGAALEGVPKPMATIGDRPFLELLIERVAARGFHRFILCLGYGAASIRSHFARNADWEIVFSEEPVPLGTAGALKLCEPLRSGHTSLVMNGDSWCDFDPLPMLDFHVRVGAMATVAVVPTQGRLDGGFIELDARGAITSFGERDRPEGSSALFNAGVYALDSTFWNEIPSQPPCSLEMEVFPRLAGRGLFGWQAAAALYDIGTPERLDAFRRMFTS